mmetsp:Transcript_1219/g.2331  ORF Transcript_1219/g.2331 Transcript_1219/m.2331 type:complete len:96 (-) Transcript_1219:273-560(-)
MRFIREMATKFGMLDKPASTTITINLLSTSRIDVHTNQPISAACCGWIVVQLDHWIEGILLVNTPKILDCFSIRYFRKRHSRIQDEQNWVLNLPL